MKKAINKVDEKYEWKQNKYKLVSWELWKTIERMWIMLDKNFKDIISNIKEEVINTQIKTMQEVNSNLIMLYFKLGKNVSENKQHGNNFTKQVSTELKLTFPNMKGFSERNIRSMRLFYEEYVDDEKRQQLVAKLPWGHNLLLIEKVKDKDIRKIYAKILLKMDGVEMY